MLWNKNRKGMMDPMMFEAIFFLKVNSCFGGIEDVVVADVANLGQDSDDDDDSDGDASDLNSNSDFSDEEY